MANSIPQTDFSLGETRPEFLEADDSEIRARSVQATRNTRPMVGGGLTRRPGSLHYTDVDIGDNFSVNLPEDLFYRPITIEPVVGQEYKLVLFKNGLHVYEDGALDAEFYSLPWTSCPWVAPHREDIYIGGSGHTIYVLHYDEDTDTWSIGTIDYADLPGDHIAQPYYSLETGIEITPSATTGAITITASANVFTADYVGLRITYHDREIEITGYTSATQVSGTVKSELPPSYVITVADASGFEVGEIIVGEFDFFEGLVTAVNTGANTVTAQVLKGFEGPDATASEKLSGAQTTSQTSSVAAAGAPQASPKWKVPLVSSLFGYPTAGAIKNERLCLGGISGAPGVAILSSSRATNDFKTGLDDDDAIIRKFGNGKQVIKHIVDAGDLIYITDKGVWTVDGRDGAEINPSNFAPSKVDARGSNDISPVHFNDKVVFVSSGGDALLAAVPNGNIYIKWSVIEFSKGSSHLVDQPTSICEPVKNAKEEDRALIYANQGGDAVAVYGDSAAEEIGFFPWVGATEQDLPDTVVDHWDAPNSDAGKFLHFLTTSDAVWALVYRGYDANGLNGTVFLEKLDNDVYLDCVTTHVGGTSPALTEYTGFDSVTVVQGEIFVGEFDTLAEATAAIAAGSASETYHVGVRWMPRVFPWPKEHVEHPKYGMRKARTLRVGVSMRSTTSFFCYRNNTKRDIEAYGPLDDLTAQPPAKTKSFNFTVLGNRDHPSIEIGQEYPGAWKLLKFTSEVK